MSTTLRSESMFSSLIESVCTVMRRGATLRRSTIASSTSPKTKFPETKANALNPSCRSSPSTKSQACSYETSPRTLSYTLGLS